MLIFSDEAYLNFLFPILGVGLFLVGIALFRIRRFLHAYPLFRNVCTSLPVFFFKGLFLMGFMVFTFLAAMGPREKMIVYEPIKEGMSVVASVDCSLSMLAPIQRDNMQARISVALDSVHAVMQSLPHDRKGVTCFANSIINSTSLTTDYVRVLKPQINKINEYLIASAGTGTNFAAAIDGCMYLFELEHPRKKVCIIISDGEPQGHEGILQQELQKKVRDVQAIKVQNSVEISFYLVGVGDPNRSYKIPRKDERGNFAGFVCCDEKDNIIETRPDPTFLSGIAHAVGGKFVHIEKGSELISVIKDIINKERKTIRHKAVTVLKDRSPVFFAAGLFCAFLFFFTPKHFSRNK